MLNTPVLFLIFNRPDSTQQVFEAIRQVKPKQLFVAADGPRADRPDDEGNCKKARNIILQVDWDCEVKTLFRKSNMGCGPAVSSAISWFFTEVEEGIILEDDCLPSPSFFNFCQVLLRVYRKDDRVFHISGSNFQSGRWRGKNSYYFSKYVNVWGWATWRRAWEKYTYEINYEPEVLNQAFPHLKTQKIKKDWEALFSRFNPESVNTWDYQWVYTCLKSQGLAAVPNKNLIKNLGFGAEATHTLSEPEFYATIKWEEIEFPLLHPSTVAVNLKADLFEYRLYHPWKQKVQYRINLLRQFVKRSILRLQ